MKLLLTGGSDLIELATGANRPAKPGSDLSRVDPRIDGPQDQLSGFRVGLEYRLVRNDPGGPRSWNAELQAALTFDLVARARDEVDTFGKDPAVDAADYHWAPRMNRNLRGAATPG